MNRHLKTTFVLAALTTATAGCSDGTSEREARLAAKLAHPSIISAIDMGEIDGLWWYAMELVDGQSLADRLKEKGPLTEREALERVCELSDIRPAVRGRTRC